jgi:hypothetical protein
MRRCVAGVALVFALDACKTQATPDASAVDVPAPQAVIDAALPGPPVARPSPPTVFGEWERRGDPYKGMRIGIRAEAPDAATVTGSATGNACQQSLWKPGDVLYRAGKIVVRDWGVVQGRCEHRDTTAPAKLTVSDDGATLSIAVTRAGKTVVQEWSRVSGAAAAPQ